MTTETGAATPQLAVSVIPVLAGDGGTLEVFIQHRAASMDFAAGVVVFPGGRVSPEDHEPCADEQSTSNVLDRNAIAWSRTSIAGLEGRTIREMCQVLLRCCQREVHEETGWWLAVEDLIPWANWVTPPDLPKRFDTFFYVAIADERAKLSHTTTEADRSEWRSVPSVLADHAAGRIRLMRPTLALLEELQQRDTSDLLMGPVEEITANRPRKAGPY